MGLKILHTADWHMDSPFAQFSPEQRELLMKLDETMNAGGNPKRKKFLDMLKDFFD